ncbi:MAG: hypothetical protein ACPIOQ_02235 [Promethearchaeia archaeon]
MSGLHLPQCKKFERSASPPLLLANLENSAEQKVGDKTQEKKVEDRSDRREQEEGGATQMEVCEDSGCRGSPPPPPAHTPFVVV